MTFEAADDVNVSTIHYNFTKKINQAIQSRSTPIQKRNVTFLQAVFKLYQAITTVWPETHYRAGSWRQILFYNLLDYVPTEVADVCFELLLSNQIEPDAVMVPSN